MTFHPLDIRLAEDGISIGPVPVVPRGNSVGTLTRILGAPDRIVSLSHNNTVYVYDRTGIRFWAEAGVVGELQLVLETEARETFPTNSFVGPLEYQRRVLYPPIAGNALANGNWPGFVQDTDPLQYGVVLFEAKKPLITYTAIINAQTGNVKTISAN